MKHLIFLLAVVLLTACSTTPPPRDLVADPDQAWQQRKTALSKINDWVLSGRVAIINGDESWMLNMDWQRHDDKFILDLSGAFGAGHSQLTGTDEGVILVDSDKNFYTADSPDRLLQEVTGLRMPVKGLLYWMRGIPNGNIKHEKARLDEYGRLALLQQDGWSIRFKGYLDVETHELPQKIFLEGHNLKVKIFVDEWDLKSKKFRNINEEG